MMKNTSLEIRIKTTKEALKKIMSAQKFADAHVQGLASERKLLAEDLRKLEHQLRIKKLK